MRRFLSSLFAVALSTVAASTLSAQVSFQSTSMSTTNTPLGIVVADANGDNVPDILVNSGQQIDTFLSNWDGSFTRVPYTPFPTEADNLPVLADFDHDGLNDLVIVRGSAKNSQTTPEYISVAFGLGNGAFSPFYDIRQIDARVGTLLAADFNGDGNADLAYSVLDSNGNVARMVVQLGHGDGTFGSPIRTAGARGTITADFNGDGLPDIAGSDGAGRVAVWLSNGDGNLTHASTFSTNGGQAGTSTSLAAGDFDGDTIPDIVVSTASSTTNKIEVWVGDGSGQFQRIPGISTPASSGVAIGDFNGDGKLDAATSTYSNALVFLGNGDGSLQAPLSFSVPSVPKHIASGDFNSDGLTDLVVDSNEYGNITVLMNTTPRQQ